jgi:hypothetical protein
MLGIIHSNHFNVLHVDEFVDMYEKIGVEINVHINSDKFLYEFSQSDNPTITSRHNGRDEVDVGSPKTPNQYNTYHKLEDRGENVWIYVTRNKRDKHPRNKYIDNNILPLQLDYIEFLETKRQQFNNFYFVFKCVWKQKLLLEPSTIWQEGFY